MKLRISPIGPEVHKLQLLRLFEEYGSVDTVQILRGSREAIALVDMPSVRDAEDAIKGVDGTEIGGFEVHVEFLHDHITPKSPIKPIVLDDDDDDDDDFEEEEVTEVEDDRIDEGADSFADEID